MPGIARYPGSRSSDLRYAVAPRRSRRAGSPATSIVVQAIATAPSSSAWSAAGLAAAAVNSGWWLTAGSESIPSIGWIEGMASDTFAMSVEPLIVRSDAGGNTRPESLRVLPVEGRHRLVGDEFGIPRPLEQDLEGGAGRERPCLEASHDPGFPNLEILQGLRPEVELRDGQGGHDVRCRTAVGHDAVYLIVRAGVLAQEPDRDLGNRDRVRGIDAPIRVRRSVRLLARVPDVEVPDCEAGHAVELVGRRVNHERGVDAVEAAPLHHEDLPAAALLCRCAEHAHCDSELVRKRSQREGGPDRGRCDDVVPAGVADLRQRVVLRADCDGERP